MQKQLTFLVFGATGKTGQHFVSLALEQGHQVRVLARTPAKLKVQNSNLYVQQGSISDPVNLDQLLDRADHVVCMLGDVAVQRKTKINMDFMRRLIPAMRRCGVKRLLYQAGGLSTPYKGQLSPLLWAIRHTIARGYAGQHQDNEAVMTYLAESAQDVEWIVHRAGIGSDGPSRGVLERSSKHLSVATHRDCAAYSYRILSDPSAVHTCDFSCYDKNS